MENQNAVDKMKEWETTKSVERMAKNVELEKGDQKICPFIMSV